VITRARPEISAEAPARVMLLGGAKLDGPRHIRWNFVSSSKDRIEQASATGKTAASATCRATTVEIVLAVERMDAMCSASADGCDTPDDQPAVR
jgi:hypothetical protein